MSSKIRILSDHTINQIAAGEVIENPASVIKELVENALDAGAQHICIEIRCGGRQLMRVSDDGCGMSRDDALLSLERHATSKISQVTDIQELITMGFRGEALPSIASISKLMLLTAPQPIDKDSPPLPATLLFSEGGRLISCHEATRAPGTTIEISSLFYNVPVRRKFQRSPAFDTQAILKMVMSLALAYPTVQFELISDQESVLKTPQSDPSLPFCDLLQHRLSSVMESDYTTSLIPISYEKDGYRVEGFIGLPHAHRANRMGQFLFINRRSVFSSLISNAIREGYSTMLPSQRHPLFVLHLGLPGSHVDVNVHPQKREVRLRQELQLRDFLLHAVQQALHQSLPSMPSLPYCSIEEEATIPPFWVKDIPPSPSPLSSPFPPYSPAPSSPPLAPQQLLLPTSSPLAVWGTLLGYSILDPQQVKDRLFPPHHLPPSETGGIVLLDQRAAYMRLHYEQLLRTRQTSPSQTFLLPPTASLDPLEATLISESLPLLQEMGLSLREGGPYTFIADALPPFLSPSELTSFLQVVAQEIMTTQVSRQGEGKRKESMARAACRASIPRSRVLSQEEVRALVSQLLLCELPYHCPFGKPVCAYLSPKELARYFHNSH